MPEFFEVKMVDAHLELDANARLHAAPAAITKIGADLLRARLVDVSRESIL